MSYGLMKYQLQGALPDFLLCLCGTKGNPCPVVGINTQDSRPYFQRVEKQENCLRDDST